MKQIEVVAAIIRKEGKTNYSPSYRRGQGRSLGWESSILTPLKKVSIVFELSRQPLPS